MKKFVIYLLLVVPFMGKAAIYTTKGLGGAWNGPTTWNQPGTPGILDNVTIGALATVTISSNQNVGNITINALGTLQFTGTYTLTIGGSFTNNGGTLTPSTGTVQFISVPLNPPQTIGGMATTFYNLTIADGLNTVTLGANETVSNNLTITSGTLDVSSSNYNLIVGGNFSNSGIFTARSGTVTMKGATPTSTQTIGGASTTIFNNLTINTSPGITVMLANSEKITSTLLISRGILNAESYNLTVGGTVGGTFTDDATFTPSTGIVYMTGTNSTITGSTSSSPVPFNRLTISGTTTLAVNIKAFSDITINSGATLAAATYSVTMAGNFSSNGAFTESTGETVTLDGVAAVQTVTGVPTFYNLTIAGISGDRVILKNSETVKNNLTITSGTLSTAFNLTVGSSLSTATNSYFSQTSGTVTMTGTASQIGGGGSTAVNKLTIGTGASGEATTLAGTVSTDSNITIMSGARLNGAKQIIETAGNFIVDGIFSAGLTAITGGTVIFDGMGNQCILAASLSSTVTFWNITVTQNSILGTNCHVVVDGKSTILPGGQMACTCN